MKGDPRAQLSLFGPQRPARYDMLEALRAKLPAGVRFGTSSYAYPGWKDIVYFDHYASDRDFKARVLEEYIRSPLFDTLGIDRAYYAPIPDAELLAYARAMPAGFVPVTKVWSEVTAPVFPRHARYGARAGQDNPRFLDPVLFDEAMGEPFARAFGDKRPPFVLEIPPSPLELPALLRALARFFEAQDGRHRFAVELRNHRLLSPRYFNLLRHYGATHVLNYWERMPGIAAQLEKARPLPSPFLVLRLLIAPGQTYEDRREAFAPFDRLVLPQPHMRAEVVAAIREAVGLGYEVFVIVGNKAEGSAPLTAEAIAALLTEG